MGMSAGEVERQNLPMPVVGAELKSYFLAHTQKPAALATHYTIKKPLHVFKAARIGNRTSGFLIVNLIIQPGAVVFAPDFAFESKLYSSAESRKMRASAAFVHSISNSAGTRACRIASSGHDRDFKYQVGKLVRPFFPYSWREESCASGIHFFLNVADAYDYYLP